MAATVVCIFKACRVQLPAKHILGCPATRRAPRDIDLANALIMKGKIR